MTSPALPHVHPTAIVSPEANLLPDVKIGPYTIIEGPVTLGPGCVIGPHVQLIGPLTMGANNEVGAGSVLGGAPQHLGYKGEVTAVEIGSGNIFREHVTIHRGMPVGAGPGTGVTRIGDRGFFMAGAHIAHDCVVGNDVILANAALLGGHVTVGDRAFISGNSAVHQFCRVGRLAFLSGASGSSKDIPPFWVMQDVNYVRGLNLIGMRRAGIPPAERTAIRKAYRIIYMTRPALPLSAALARIEAEVGEFPAVQELVEFIRTSKRGICGAHRLASDASDDESAAA
ncbi:Acyl-[acyl-carrier-protein]--UDP-N-acetylglucosamine O-acyltransferase [Gemmata obscuriglobus]|nr:acyl-ACP--UDP-N-acetylglucosamine O-acyltransferase [Gemmata obscuriglobus]QEG28228.1 Acyl-[acyl-carrier-protein]--UDP-N-acetylglucosamine O-acyltransferase [Gemmata obscuriglobus]VTS05993.1 udp-n-acetylglucosamine acyltransferase : Acyl-[acyl-carrier-protein]--UDP-N-acetylglucosamine O-acyltransferase OS=Singulisphaera acidiphila (strain ATCC BAA-1392 / DSM 18658 / VKM B-2454 / MOB10) GN=Sinac_3720 PE=4 SV=1: Hexapep: Hexapep: Acetyltransf_11 [Gemmata obscuriglobus UQM 2246]